MIDMWWLWLLVLGVLAWVVGKEISTNRKHGISDGPDEYQQDPSKFYRIADGRYTFRDEDDGSLLIKTYRNGKLNGPSYWHYGTGELWMEESYVDGLIHGTCKMYEKDGSIKATQVFEFGRNTEQNRVRVI